MIAKKVFIGVALGLVITAVGFFLYTHFMLKLDMLEAIKVLAQQDSLGTVLFISAIPNLLAFFMLINRGHDYKARGVIIASFIIAFLILATQFA